MSRIAFTCGGTGGHVYPCIALAQEQDVKEVLFLGAQNREDQKIVKRYGFQFEGVPTTRKNPVTMIRSFLRARYILKKFACEKLFASGGYTTPPVILAAWTMGIPVTLLEQNVIPGKANRVMQVFADHVMVSFNESAGFFKKNKVAVTGNPIRKVFLQDAYIKAITAVQLPDMPKVLVMGGSQGANAINLKMMRVYQNESPPFVMIHLTGEAFYKEKFGSDKITVVKKDGRVNAIVCPYCESLDTLYSMVDLVVSRAGATTVAELLHFNKPAILIPYPYAKSDHQTQNAKAFVKGGYGKIIQETDPEFKVLGQEIVDMLKCLNAL
ncbi:MAG: UDP-N-acetylglucosamine--N-acetylmuramyl-(pentapeptide) pyrophosphoryl-undecaprenol N-acetylglucosamine transferase [Candidatus Margulisbacteria bacterium]|nr:UDP-N-acetylglucosamine--N-acetylmuramyl-(pentapeptide) pyrophosphoryl-undecaprenol N-acetylglucosamine transferase [Candidatus Margulisiibacteriota bacterium]